MLTLYEHPRCSTCKKAVAFLKEAGIAYQSIDITQTPPTQAELQMALDQLGSLRKLFNTSGQKYREMGLKDKLGEMTEEEAMSLLLKDGMLVKRPFLVKGTQVLVGFKEADWQALA